MGTQGLWHARRNVPQASTHLLKRCALARPSLSATHHLQHKGKARHEHECKKFPQRRYRTARAGTHRRRGLHGARPDQEQSWCLRRKMNWREEHDTRGGRIGSSYSAQGMSELGDFRGRLGQKWSPLCRGPRRNSAGWTYLLVRDRLGSNPGAREHARRSRTGLAHTGPTIVPCTGLLSCWDRMIDYCMAAMHDRVSLHPRSDCSPRGRPRECSGYELSQNCQPIRGQCLLRKRVWCRPLLQLICADMCPLK